MPTIDGIINEPTVNFVGKDGFFWWVGEVEDNEDPMALGRVKVRVLGYYTNVRGGTTADLPTESLPWATVMQHTSQQVMISKVNLLVNYNLVQSSWDSSWMENLHRCLLSLVFCVSKSLVKAKRKNSLLLQVRW